MILTNDFFENLYVILTENVMATNVWDFIFFSFDFRSERERRV